MQPSQLNTTSVPAIGGSQPARVYQAGATPMRLMVRNVGGTTVFLAHEVSDLRVSGSLAGVYQLPSGQSDVFVLAPEQSLFASSNGAAGQVSIAASEAIPVGKSYMES